MCPFHANISKKAHIFCCLYVHGLLAEKVGKLVRGCVSYSMSSTENEDSMENLIYFGETRKSQRHLMVILTHGGGKKKKRISSHQFAP